LFVDRYDKPVGLFAGIVRQKETKEEESEFRFFVSFVAFFAASRDPGLGHFSLATHDDRLIRSREEAEGCLPGLSSVSLCLCGEWIVGLDREKQQPRQIHHKDTKAQRPSREF
jgi:hypothetical protein